MRWHGITGSWRTTNEKVEKDVINRVKNIISNGEGIVSGGALGVDYIATKTALDYGNFEQIKLFLPIQKYDFMEHYFKRHEEGVISLGQAKDITRQLYQINEISPESIIDSTPYHKADSKSYYARNSQIVEISDILEAFQVNNSHGVEDTIKKAKDKGIPINLKKYEIKLNQIDSKLN